MSPPRFYAALSLTTAHLVRTPLEGHPKEAVEAVRAAVEAIPGAAIVSVDWCGDLPGTWHVLDWLELVNVPNEASAFRALQAAIEEAVTEALMASLRPLPPLRAASGGLNSVPGRCRLQRSGAPVVSFGPRGGDLTRG